MYAFVTFPSRVANHAKCHCRPNHKLGDDRPYVMCRAVTQGLLVFKLFLSDDLRRALYTSTIVTGTAQHTLMEGVVKATVCMYVHSVVD